MLHRMSRVPARPRAAAALLVPALLFLPVAAGAQQPPSRIGNIWDNLPHQPSQGDVSAAERERGVEPPQQRQRDIDSELERLNQQLLSTEQNDPAVHAR